MRAFFQKALKLMGAEVKELSTDDLQVNIPEESLARGLFEGRPENLLVFSSKKNAGRAAYAGPGSSLLESVAQELARKGAVRQGALPALHNFSRKALRNKFSVTAGSEKSFSVKRLWKTVVRMWVKAILTGDEVYEIIEGIEVRPDGRIKRIENNVSIGENVRWVEKPPLKLYELKKRIGSGMEFAGNLVIEKAEALQKKNLKRLYSTLERLRIYYRELNEEVLSSGSKEDLAVIKADYKRRQQEELLYARLKATIKLIAVETISTPVQQLCWELTGNGGSKRVVAGLDLFNGEISTPVRCQMCEKETFSFGLSRSNLLFCPDCYNAWDFSGDDTAFCVGCREHYPNLQTKACNTCGQTVCSTCCESCLRCSNIFCLNHIKNGECETCRTNNTQINLF